MACPCVSFFNLHSFIYFPNVQKSLFGEWNKFYFSKSCLSLIGNSCFLERNSLCVIYDNSNKCVTNMLSITGKNLKLKSDWKPYKCPISRTKYFWFTELKLRLYRIICNTPILKKQSNNLDLVLNSKFHHGKGIAIKHVTFDLIRKQLQQKSDYKTGDLFDKT